MREILVRLRFLTPCLGHLRAHDCDRFERDADDNVIFMNTWWRQLFDYGAKAVGKHQRDVQSVRVHPVVAGDVSKFKRYYGPNKYKLHEAFKIGSEISVRIMLPDSLPVDDFLIILEKAGGYRGISPYGWAKGFGQFEVTHHEVL
jgi:hypothetical protein